MWWSGQSGKVKLTLLGSYTTSSDTADARCVPEDAGHFFYSKLGPAVSCGGWYRSLPDMEHPRRRLPRTALAVCVMFIICSGLLITLVSSSPVRRSGVLVDVDRRLHSCSVTAFTCDHHYSCGPLPLSLLLDSLVQVLTKML